MFLADHAARLGPGVDLGARHVVQLLGVFGGGAQRVVVEEYGLCPPSSVTVSDVAFWLQLLRLEPFAPIGVGPIPWTGQRLSGSDIAAELFLGVAACVMSLDPVSAL